jgi:DNA processing protein
VSPELPYQISLTKIEGVGDINAKSLVSYCGSAEAVFKEKKSFLEKIPNIGEITARSISKFQDFETVEKEIQIIQKHQIKPIFYLDEEYPARLKNCEDSPIMLYYKGNVNLNQTRVLAIVGTRNATSYGKHFTEQLCEALAPYHVLVVSGLASGTDANVHHFALKSKLSTIGVLGHGLQTIYPSENRNLAIKMLSNGGLLTEFGFGTPGNKENFPRRNRIVAGMCDATIVIESALKGGSLITAEIANSYNRDVFALPGKITDTWSLGCNKLISDNKAAIISSIDQLIFSLGYSKKVSKKKQQIEMMISLNEDEKKLYEILKKGPISIDELSLQTNMKLSKLALILLDLEFKNLIQSLPGKKYSIL